MAKKPSTLNFEQSLHNLEKLVEAMESGDMTLEQSLETFEQGIRLTKECQQALREAEQKVEILMSRNGEETLESFGPEDEAHE